MQVNTLLEVNQNRSARLEIVKDIGIVEFSVYALCQMVLIESGTVVAGHLRKPYPVFHRPVRSLEKIRKIVSLQRRPDLVKNLSMSLEPNARRITYLGGSGIRPECLVAGSHLDPKRLEVVLRPVKVSAIDRRPDIDSKLTSFPFERGSRDE